MATIINADTVTGGAIITADNSGVLQLKTGGVTAMTIGTDQSVTFTGTVVGASPTLQLVASGSLANGDKVVINADGTVSKASGSLPQQFKTGSISSVSIGSDTTNGKIVIAYADASNSNYGTAVVGTVSGDQISFGTPVVFATNNISAGATSTAFDVSNGKIVVSYTNSSGYGTSVVGTVSGNSISFGTPVVFRSAATYYITSSYHPTSAKIGIFYQSGTGIAGGGGILGTVSGTSISFAGGVTIGTANTGSIASCYYAAADVFAVCWSNNGNSNKLTLTPYSVSAGALVAGTSDATGESNTSSCFITYGGASKGVAVVCYASGMTRWLGVSYTISGTTATRTNSVFLWYNVLYTNLALSYDELSGNFIFCYSDPNNTDKSYYAYGTSIAFNGGVYTFPVRTSNMNVTYNPTTQSMIYAYTNTYSDINGYGYVIKNLQITNVTSGNYIGISNASYTNGQTATIQTVGAVDDAQTGLIAGQLYYLLPSGGLSTTAGTPSVAAGTALSATKIFIR